MSAVPYRVVETREGDRRTMGGPSAVKVTARSTYNYDDVLFVEFYADPPSVGDMLLVGVEKQTKTVVS